MSSPAPKVAPSLKTRYRHVHRLFVSLLLLTVLAACGSLVDAPPASPPGSPSPLPEAGPGDPTQPLGPQAPDQPTTPTDPEAPGEPPEPATPTPTPPPPTEPSDPTNPPPSEGLLLWNAGMETGDQSEWYLDGGGGEYNSGSGDATVSTAFAHTGSFSLRMRIDTNRGGGGTRQFRWNEFDNPDTTTVLWAYLPEHIGLDRFNDWFNFIQWKAVKWQGSPGGPYAYNDPIWSLDIHERGGPESGGNNYLQLVDFDHEGGVTSEDAPASMNLPIGKWFKLTMRYVQGVGTDGSIKVWLNDELMFDKTGIQTVRPDQDYTGWSANAYADITHPRVTDIYLDDLAIYLPEGARPMQLARQPVCTPAGNGAAGC